MYVEKIGDLMMQFGFLKMLSLNMLLSEKQYSQLKGLFEPATSCARDQDIITSAAKHMLQKKAYLWNNWSFSLDSLNYRSI